MKNLVEKFVEALKNGDDVYFCEWCGLLEEYKVREEYCEIVIRDVFTDEILNRDFSEETDEIECPKCGSPILQINDVREAIEELESFVEENPNAELEKQVLEKLKELMPQCPNCKSKNIDQRCYDRAGEKEYYHCANCGVWFDEKGVVELEKVRC